MQQKSNITYQGFKQSFSCSEESWNLYKELIKAWCDGEPIEHYSEDSWNLCEKIHETNLHEYRVKSVEYSKHLPQVGEVWVDRFGGHFVICTETDRTGQVFWLEHSKISSGGFRYKQIVFDNLCTKAYDCLEDYFNKEK